MIISVLLTGTLVLNAQKVTRYTTTEKSPWVVGKTSLAAKAEGTVVAKVDGNEHSALGAPRSTSWIGTPSTC